MGKSLTVNRVQALFLSYLEKWYIAFLLIIRYLNEQLPLLRGD